MPDQIKISKLSIFILVFFAFITFIFIACKVDNSYFTIGNYKKNRELKKLYNLLASEKDEIRFVLVRQIADILLDYSDRNKQILFLTNYVEKNPLDSFNSYYLLLVAESFVEQGAIPFAVHYYNRILNNHPDIVIQNSNIHLHCLKKLLQYVEEGEPRLFYYKELIARFEDQLEDKGKVYYSLAKTYEDLGEWDQAIQAYQKFLKQPRIGMPGFKDIYKKVEEKIDFYNSDYIKWTVEELDFLVKEIKNAILYKNAVKLEKYKAKVNFFTMYWEQKNYDETRAKYFNISNFLFSSDVKVDSRLNIDSNANEAFLKTTRWSYRIPTWYFYFRRIDFPIDPEIDGRWEWAGIYFGEKY